MEKTISAIDSDRETSYRASNGESRGLVPAVVHLGVDVAASGVTTGTAIVHELRAQATSLTVQSLTFVETLVRGLCDAGRRLATEMDRAGQQATNNVEKIALSTFSAVKNTTDQAAQLATTTVDAVVGRRNQAGQPIGANN
jgi:hypothetical protein